MLTRNLSIYIVSAALMACANNTSGSSGTADSAAATPSDAGGTQDAGDTGAGPCASLEVTTETADDGCTVVNVPTDCWTSPLHAAYSPNAAANDPFFQLHDNEDGFYFNVELYTQYGAEWTGQLGTFDANCETHGICVYLVPDDVAQYLAVAGTVEITALAQSGDQLQLPVDITLRDLRLQPVPGTSFTGCYHIKEVRLHKEG